MAVQRADHCSTPIQQQYQGGEDDARHGEASDGTHRQRFVESAVTDASPTGNAFGGGDTLFMHDINIGRTDLAANPARDTTFRVSGHTQRRERGNETQKRPVRAEIAAERVSQYD